MDAVRCYIDGCPKSWDQYLGPLAGALRSAINRHTGYTANKLILVEKSMCPQLSCIDPQIPMIFKMGRKEKWIDMCVICKKICKGHMRLPGKG